MTATRLIEYRITRQLLQRRDHGATQGCNPQTHGPVLPCEVQPWADRVIAILAVTAVMLVVGSYVEELLWAALAGATVYTLR